MFLLIITTLRFTILGHFAVDQPIGLRKASVLTAKTSNGYLDVVWALGKFFFIQNHIAGHLVTI